MKLHLGLGSVLILGIAATLFACNTTDEIADGSGGSANTGGGSNTGGAQTGGTNNPDGGKCTDVCTPNASLCIADRTVACVKMLNGCFAWQAGDVCPTGQQCNSDGTKCISPAQQCAADADCGCGCGCMAGSCQCTGLVPPSCSSDADCGPSCAGLACVSGKCTDKFGPGPCKEDCTLGAQRCAGTSMLTCIALPDMSGCHAWAALSECAAGESCNADGTKCVATTASCSADADCGCGCGCVSGECKCTGGTPPSCSTDADCGPACSGLACVNGKCVDGPTPPPPADGGTCVPGCTAAGQTRCIGATVDECKLDALGCLQWMEKSGCPAGQLCNADGTSCVLPQNSCGADSDCGCGCFCMSGSCACTGVVPPSCSSDADCGPACGGFVCAAGQCVQIP